MNADADFDEFCDPNNPCKIKYDDILAASKRIADAIIRTPCSKSHISQKLGINLYLKEDFLQYTGSFKERGVRNALLCLKEEQKKTGVISASIGNHGLALSHHAKLLDIPCVVIMPMNTPIVRRSRCESYGAKVILHGNDMAEAQCHAMSIAKDRKMLYINGYDHPNVIEGQGTIAIEILEQLPTADAILVPVGGGSLLTGVAIAAKHLKPEIEIYGIETDKTCSMAESLRKNERVFYKTDPNLADGLSVNMVGVNSFFNIKQGIVDKLVVVKEDWVARAVTQLVEKDKLVVEGAGAAGVGGVLAGLFPQLKGKKIVAIVSGGNIAVTALTRTMERGLAAEGRLLKFKVAVTDKPGGMADLMALLANAAVAVRNCTPEREWVKGDVFSCVIKLVVETKGWDHTKDLIEQIKNNYEEYYFAAINDRPDNSPSTKRGPCLAPNPVCMQK